MTKWLPVLGALVVSGLLAIWLLRHEDARSAPAQSVTDPAVVRGIQPAVEQTSMAHVPQRESLVGGTADEASRESEWTKAQPHAEDWAVLVVQAVDKVTGAPLPHVRASLALREGRSSSMFVESAKGGLNSAPVSGTDGRVQFEAPQARS